MSKYQEKILTEKINNFGGINNIILLYNQNNSTCDIAKKIGASPSSIRNRLSGYVKFRTTKETSKKYFFNENVFSEELDENSAYWLGFIMGDGSINKNNNRYCILKVCLNKRDYNHLVKLKNFLNSNSPIFDYKKDDTMYLSVQSDKIVSDMINYGVIPNKSYENTFVKNINNNKRDFWRGLIDADGHIIKDNKKKNRWILGLTGTENLCNQFKSFIDANGIVSKAKVIKVSENAYRILYGGNQLPKKIIKLLYGNANIYLERKYEMAMKCINEEIK